MVVVGNLGGGFTLQFRCAVGLDLVLGVCGLGDWLVGGVRLMVLLYWYFAVCCGWFGICCFCWFGLVVCWVLCVGLFVVDF